MAQPRDLSALPLPSGYRSTEVASFIAQLDDQTSRLTEDTRGLSVAELAWQPAPGMNTIGMLLAHNALVEVWWTGFVLEDLGRDEVRFEEILGSGGDDDGMPMAEGAKPPAALAGRNLAFYDDLLARARAHLKQVAAQLTDADLTRTLQKTSLKGTMRTIEFRWTLYHMLEHFAGHYGQILLLKHAHKAGLHVHIGEGSGRKGAKERAPRARATKPKRPAARPKRAAKLKRAAAKKSGHAKPGRASGAGKSTKKPKRRR
jgi:hypothetical protein